jgi:CBS domain-containing protein
MLDAYLAGGPEPTDAVPVLLDCFDGRCGGLLEARSVRAVPPEQRPGIRALDLATELQRVPTARPDQSVAEVGRTASLSRGATGLLVVDAEEPVGWLALDELRRRLSDP